MEFTSLNAKFMQLNRIYCSISSAAFALTLLLTGSQPAYAASRCLPEHVSTAAAMRGDASTTVDDIDRLILYKRSLSVCPEYSAWLELGKVELKLENYIDAAYAFENAVDFYQGSNNSEYSTSQLQRIAIANGWLAETYALNDELAYALVATQEAAASFDALGQATPGRLLVLQATLDDATSQADATVLARSFQIQHQRASRGIGVRPRLIQESESAAMVEETVAIVSDYTGESAAAQVAVAPAQSTDQPGTSSAEASVAASATESRLNIPVLFEFDSATLTPRSLVSINRLGVALASLKMTEQDSVLVVGHTDSQGAAAYNLSLSQQRARSVSATLGTLLNGQVRMVSEGRGENELRYTANTADDHRRNRRVELIVRRN